MPQNALAANIGVSKGVYGPTQLDAQKSIWASDRHGKYYQGAYNATGAFAANPTAKVTTAGLATTYTGLCVSNPAASTVNLVIQTVSGAFVVVTTAITVGSGLITGVVSAAGVVTHTTPLTPQTTKLGTTITSPIIQGLADSACTLVGTPVWSGMLATVESGAVAGSAFYRDINGEIIITPGGYIAIGTTIISGAAGMFACITWEEVPV